MKSAIKKLNRFTTFPFLIDLLTRKKLTLLNPAFWEDFNDRETIEIYRQRVDAASIYALCLTHKNETIHHWNAFANGTSGCCIEFSPRKLFNILDNEEAVIYGEAEYISINNLPDFEIQQLPFVKRLAFNPENEYRIIAISDEEQQASFDIDIDLDIIRKITISNKVPKVVFKSMKAVIHQIAPQMKADIYHSTLYNSQTWVKHWKQK